MTAKEIQEKWRTVGLKKIEHDQKTREDFYGDYAKFFGHPCVTCTSKLNSYFLKLINSKTETMEERKFILKNILLQVTDRAVRGHYTNANMTDKKAIEILKVNPAHIQSFEKYPENWNELIGMKAVAQPKAENDTDTQAEEENATVGFAERLEGIDGIGPKSVEAIMLVYSAEDELVEALKSGNAKFNAKVTAKLESEFLTKD
jgi:hypothetical protein